MIVLHYQKKMKKKVCFWTNSVQTLAYCEWREEVRNSMAGVAVS